MARSRAQLRLLPPQSPIEPGELVVVGGLFGMATGRGPDGVVTVELACDPRMVERRRFPEEGTA